MFGVGSIVAGKYRVERELGRGGMGMVVAATHVHLGTTVALKFLNDKMMADPTVVARFLREARATAQLDAQHICRILDYGTEHGVPYIVMELLEGTDLAQLVRHAPLDVPTAAEYVIQACLGLAEAHAAQVIHRDLKPSNLFLTRRPDGAPLIKIVDFGVAKAPEAVDVNLTQTASVVGSPGYMSPEQVRSSRNVDARSDIWALGVILYKLVSGRMPFKAESITDLAVAIAMDPVPPLLDVPLAFDAIVQRCLAKDPARRYQDAMALVAALSPFTAGGVRDTVPFDVVGPPRTTAFATVAADSPTTLRGASGVLEALPPRPRNLRPWIIGAALSVLVGVGAGLTWTSDSAAPAAAARPAVVVPVVEAPPPAPLIAPPAVVVVPVPAPAVPVAPAKPAVEAKPAAKSRRPAAHVTAPAKAAPEAPPPPAAPKDIGASRI